MLLSTTVRPTAGSKGCASSRRTLIRRKVAVIVTGGATAGVRDVVTATKTIPIVRSLPGSPPAQARARSGRLRERLRSHPASKSPRRWRRHSAGRHWAEVGFAGVSVTRIASDVELFTYEATARWNDEKNPGGRFAQHCTRGAAIRGACYSTSRPASDWPMMAWGLVQP